MVPLASENEPIGELRVGAHVQRNGDAATAYAERDATHAPPLAQEATGMARVVRAKAAGGFRSAEGKGGMGRGGGEAHTAPRPAARS